MPLLTPSVPAGIDAECNAHDGGQCNTFLPLLVHGILCTRIDKKTFYTCKCQYTR